MILFCLLTFSSMRVDRDLRQQHHRGRYFWWGSVRLDSDPLNKRPLPKPCAQATDQTCGFDPQYIWVVPGLIEWALRLSALPAFLLTVLVMHGLDRFGISELLSFMITMPLLTLVWFYSVGWLLDRWRYKRSLRRSSADASLK